MPREATITRKTSETDIELYLAIDGSGKAEISTGIGFFDHMLHHIARHGLFDLRVKAEGDLHIDPHHTVEDVGIALGQALLQAVGVPAGLTRYGHALAPMDEALAEVSLDFSGRPFLHFDVPLPHGRLGDFDTELTEEFMRAFAVNSRLTLHVMLRHGSNTHHCIEAVFKATARALREALSLDPRSSEVPSTKGMLQA